mgnify:CR=1 FL=1
MTVKEKIVNFKKEDMFDADKRRKYELLLQSMVASLNTLGQGDLMYNEVIDLGITKYEIFNNIDDNN